MKALIATVLLVPLMLGVIAWILGPARATESREMETREVLSMPPPSPEPSPVAPVDATIPEDPGLATARRKLEREARRRRLEADLDEEIERLIESIDWSRAESRVRFPVEEAAIRADYERAIEELTLPADR